MDPPTPPPAWTSTGAHAAESSVPSPEQIQTDAMIRDVNRSIGRSRKKILYLAGAAVLVLCIIIGVSVGATSGKKESSSTGLRSQQSQYIGERERSVDVTQPRVKATFAFLEEFIGTDILNGDTPQRAAALWISGLDVRVVDVPAPKAEYPDSFRFMQRWILGVLWYSLDGFNWNQQVDFMSHHDECHWNYRIDGVPPEGSDPDKFRYGVQCDDDGSVSYIRITGNNMKGELPRELGLLVAMKHFSVFGNSISGSIPDTLQYWNDTEFLAVESNELTGSIPSWISNWKNLNYLALGNNKLSGPLPPAFSELKELKQVALEFNEFTGGVDVFNECAKLEVLIANDNKLDGAISANTLSKLSLDIFDVSDNQMVGFIPVHFYNYRTVDLHSNKLTGILPAIDFQEDLNVEFFSVYQNQIGGTIPDNIGFLTALVLLDLSDNKLAGDIPASVATLVKLQYFYVANNPFNRGPFPDLWQSSSLREIVVRNTRRTGSIPAWVGNHQDLELLDVAENEMSGGIPANLGNLTGLRFLFANRNKFSGNLPGELVDMRAISIAMFDKNDITGSVGAMCVDGVGPSNIDHFVTDCDVQCSCCTACCQDSDASCNSETYLANVGDGYKRNQFVFSEDKIYFSQRSPEN